MFNKIWSNSAEPQTVLEYTPRKFDLGVPEAAMDYFENSKQPGADFRMADAIRVHTGLKNIEAASVTETAENIALDKLKEIQEKAYQEAYNLGLEEGKREGFTLASKEIDSRLQNLSDLISSIANLKQELFSQNEGHVVKLAYHMASRIAHKEVETSNEVVVEVLRKAIEMAQLDEDVVVQVSPMQLEFLETLQKEAGRDLEFLKQIKLVGVDEVNIGGCVIETNYGEIDARIEERINKLWSELGDSIPRVKAKITA